MLDMNADVSESRMNPEDLAHLLSWVPSHRRKFSEAARQMPFPGWTNVFHKEDVYSPLSSLLRLPGGLNAAEAICARAELRGINESIVRKAKAALRAAGVDDRREPRRSWAGHLDAAGADREASWVRWLATNSSSTDPVPVSSNASGPAPDLLAEPTSTLVEDTADPSDDSSDVRYDPMDAVTFEELVHALTEMLSVARPGDADLATSLRRAADRLDRMAEDDAVEVRRRAEMERLRDDLTSLAEEIASINGSVRYEPAAAVLAFLDGDIPSVSASGAAVLAAAVAYADAARSWRSAIDAIQDTHDYSGAAELREVEMDAWRILRQEIDAAFAEQDSVDLGSATETVSATPFPDETIDETSSVGAAEASPGVDDDRPVANDDVKSCPRGDIESDGSFLPDEAVATVEVGTSPASRTDPVDPEAIEPDPADAEAPPLEPPLLMGEGALVAPVGASHAAALDGHLAVAARHASAVAFGQRRYGLAMQVAKVAEASGLPTPFGLSSGLIEALVAGLSVGRPRSERAIELFDRRREAVVSATADGVDPAHQLIAFAAALRPALFAVEAGANELVSASTGLSRMGQGIYALAGFAEAARSGDIVPSELAELADHLAPQRQLRDLRTEMRRFYEDAQRRKIKFQRATRIWLDVLKAGSVHNALRAVIDNSPDAAERVSTALGGDLADVDRMINAADREATAGRKMQVLTAGARATLRDWLQDVAERLREWLEAHQVAHDRQRNQHSVRVRIELREAAEIALEDLGSYETSNRPARRIAVDVAVEAVSSVLSLFDRPEHSGLSLAMRLDDDLLLLAGAWRVANRETWTDDDRAKFFEEVASLQDGPDDFEGALDRSLRGGRFAEAYRARDRILLDDPSRRDGLDARLIGEMDRQVEAERKRLGQVRKRLNDLLGADDRQVLSRDLEPELDKLSAMLLGSGTPQIDLSEWRERLAEVDRALDVAFRTLIGPLQARVDRLEQSGRSIDDLRKMVEMKDLTTLSEHIEAYEAGVSPPIPPANLLETFSEAMLSSGPEERVDLPSLMQAIVGKRTVPGADFGRFEEGQLQAAADLLKAWRDLRSFQGRDASGPLGVLFNQLLTSTVTVKPAKATALPGLFELRTPVYSSRDECVAPSFGSAAGGRYDVILTDAHGISSGAELANLKTHCSAATFFVVRGRMDATARQAFMAQLRQKGADPACGLIDEAVVLFLATRPARQRSDLFALALAMGVVQPYSDAPQQTSPEMFFGRVDELRELWDPNGSCLVYGGRQLGKTALLRQIELRHDRNDQVVIYGDQDLEGFGDGRSATFWRWIARKVSARGVTISGSSGRQSADGIRTDIQAWLAQDSTRRLLFLVDEADAFLRREVRTGFSGTSILVEVRELMRVTNRRCKFVFAGLHDVQRLARTPNSPLLHFGLPIRVGPLMGKDLFEARSMVEQPMATVGYAFGANAEEGRALVGRALSEVGYYPSLMQTFGMVLINRLNGQAASRIGTPPRLPLRITEAELDEALEDNLFRENVRLKFDNTLNLDPRYRLIAYVVLLGTQEAALGDDLRPGMSIAEIQRDAMYWWSPGFAEDPTNSAFEGLLKEMEGLGVLVGLRDGRYAIRSARIAAMLGTLQQVEDRLIELAAQPYLASEDTGGSRRLIGNGPSPLTFRQEGVLLERKGASPVAVALTSESLGLDGVGDALKGVAEDQVVVVEKRISSVVELERAISTVAARMANGRSGLLVARGPWLGSDAVASAFQHAEVRRAQRNSNTGVRVILLPSMIDWNELEAFETGEPVWNATTVTLSTLQQGGLREWMARRTGNNAPPVEMLERLRSATGGFPALLGNLQGKTVEALVEAAEAAADRIIREGETAFGRFGLEDGRLRAILRFVHEQIGDEVFDTGAREALVEMLVEDGIRAPARGLDVLGTIGALDVMPSDMQGWRINPLVARMLECAG